MEFAEVMRQWKRMCMAMEKKAGDGEACALCPLEECGAIYEMSQNHDWEEDAEAVMAWAAEHPEPVYPTWREWFIGTGMWTHGLITDAVINKPIPADIAEKLGIEPKEGNHA